MSYADLTYRSRNPLKRLVQRGRFQAMFDLVAIGPEAVILDYGCGDGFFLSMLSDIVPPRQLFGFEPFRIMTDQCDRGPDRPKILSEYDELAQLGNRRFSAIFCMEVLEHLVDEDIDRALANIAGLASPQTRIVFTVPSERGLAGAAKYLFRRRAGTETVTMSTVLAVLAGRNISRSAAETSDGRYIYSHIGFDHRNLEAQLRRRFKIERICGIPFNFLPGWLNNEIVFICRTA
jgi:SAM-dependent methyltransferase